MTSPGSNAYKDTYRNVLRYTGQNYRFVPTFLRQRDPASPTSESTDVKPFEMQGYYPVNSLWTNTTNKNVWLLRGISNGKGDWVLLTGGGGGSQVIQTDNVVVPSLGNTFTFNSPNISITGDALTGTVTFNALPVLNSLDFLTDFKANGTPNGTSNPVNQKINIRGFIPTAGTFGIQTQSAQTSFANDTVFIKYIDSKVTTIGAALTVFPQTISLSNNSSSTISVQVNSRDVATGLSFGARMLIVADNFGGVTAISTIIENISGGTPPMDGCAVSAIVVGNNIVFRAKGLAATTIDWHLLVPVVASQP